MPSNQYRNRCCILLCKAHLPKSHHTTTDTRLHRFPSNGKQRQKWCTEIQEKGHQKIQKSHSKVLCSQHFKVDDYVKRKDPSKKQPHILKSGAIPSIFPLSQSLERVDLHHSFHSSDVSRNDEEFLIGVVDCNEIEYRCQECGFSTQNFNEYSLHIFTHEDSGNTTEELIIDESSAIANLSEKMLTPTAVDLPPALSSDNENMEEEVFQCLSCNFWSRTMPQFHVHVLGHSFDELFKCSLCDYKAADQNSVQHHILSNHSESSAQSVLIQEAIPGQYDQFLKRKPVPVVDENPVIEEEETAHSNVTVIVEDVPISTLLDNRSSSASHYEDPLGDANVLDNEAHKIFLVEPLVAKEQDEKNDEIRESLDNWRPPNENQNAYHSTSAGSSMDLSSYVLSGPEISQKIQMEQLESEMKEMSNQLNNSLFRERQAAQTCTDLQKSVNTTKFNLSSLSKKFRNIEDELLGEESEKAKISSLLSQKIADKMQTEVALRLMQSEVINVKISLLREGQGTNNEQQESLARFQESVECSKISLQEKMIEIEELQQKEENLARKIEKVRKSRDDTDQQLATLSAEITTIESNIKNCENLNTIRSKIESLRTRQKSCVQSFINIEKNLIKSKYFKMMGKLQKKENYWLTSLKLKNPSNGNNETNDNH